MSPLKRPRRRPSVFAVSRWLETLGVLVLAWSVARAGAGAGANSTPRPITSPGTALLLTIDGAIGPPTVEYVQRGLDQASKRNAQAVILQMDTPGGLDTSMREIIRAILASTVPVLSYVGPSGARAASAGTYILYASHVAAMAPGTNLGAATPVDLGGPKDDADGLHHPKAKPAPGSAPSRGASSGGGDRPESVTQAKSVNDAAAYIRALAALHGRNADWAERAVREAVSLSSQDALAQGVIDLVALNIADLLKQAHGRKVKLAARQGLAVQTVAVLDSRDLTVERVEPGLRTRFLSVLANPNLALILMMVGLYGLLFEFMNPGALYPGTLGALSLLLGLYSLSALPLSYAGLAILVLGLGLMAAEAFTPSLGMLGMGGALMFVLGASMLIDTDVPAYSMSLPFTAGLAVGGLGLGALIARLAVKSRAQPRLTGAAAMVGERAVVQDWSGRTGHVVFEGERWNARGEDVLSVGEDVGIVAVEGLVLLVARHVE